jgi:hypothetical protein
MKKLPDFFIKKLWNYQVLLSYSNCYEATADLPH